MLQPTLLRCSQTTAMIVFILIGSLFCLAGCAQLYKLLGLTDQQIADQLAADQTDRQQIIQRIRLTTTELITTAIAGIGAIATGFLARALGTEKKLTNVMIQGVETADSNNIKAVIQAKATAAGVQHKLDKRVQALT